MHRIHRRTMLRGLGGAVVALPFLEAMLPRRASAKNGAPCRYVGMFAGLEHRACVPSGTGTAYTMPTGLATVAAPALPVPSLEDLREHFSIVSGTEIEGTGPSGVTPPGGKANPHHGNIMRPLLTGVRSTSESAGSVITDSTPDQLVAELWGDTQFRSLQYRVQPVGYRGGTGGVKGVMSYSGSQALAPQTSPQLAYESLFTGFVPPDASPDDIEAHEKLIARKLSVLDLVGQRSERLIPKLGGFDRQRLEQHFDQIRDLERRLADVPPAAGGECQQLTDPGADPAEDDYPNTDHGGSAGYSGEDLRGHVMVDLVHMALACDLTRVATIVITQEQSVMSIAPLFGAEYEMHDVTHNDIPDRTRVWDEITTWQAGFFAKLVDKLASTVEPTGGTMLDNTAVTLTYSGGPSGHGGTNMPILVAGVPSVLRMGEHIAVSGHPCQVYQTVLHALGVDENLGDLPGQQPAMLV